MTDEFEGLTAFVAVAEALSFRRAGERLGVTHSAISQAVRRLEARVGVALLQRTTRSVRLTEAGTRLFETARGSIGDLRTTVAGLREEAGAPSGRLRLAVSSIAERFLDGAPMAAFLARHPRVQIDLTVTDEEFDIVAHGYDAGVRLGEVIERDMIAIPVSDDQRQYPVAAPGYLARAGVPAHPRELIAHRCIGWRPSTDVAPYRWEFTQGGREFDVEVDPYVTTNDMDVMVRLACAGAGITFGMEETFRPYIARGELVPMLEAYCAPFTGFFLYYPSRRTMPMSLRAFVDHLKCERRGQSPPQAAAGS